MKASRTNRPSASARKPTNIDDLIRHFILDHSEELFITHGYEKTSMDMIAKACGLSKPTLYTYFKTKYELFTSLSVRLYGSLYEVLKELLLQEGDKLRILEEFIDRYFVLMDSKKNFMKMYYREHLLIHENIEEHVAWLTDSREEIVDLLSRFLSDLVRPPIKAKYGARMVGAALFDMLEGLMSELMLHGQTGVARQKKFILELLGHGALAGRG
jgi:AcrR family transcriptional regulator